MGCIHQDQSSGQLGIKICESADGKATERMAREHVRRLDRCLPQRVTQLHRNGLGVPGTTAAAAPAKPGTVVTDASHDRSEFFLNPVPVW
jgi:hypothetical protein